MRTPTTRTRTLTTPTPTRTRTRTTPASDSALLRATEPVDAKTFLAEHWETRPLHVARGQPGRFDDLLSARDVERMLSEPGLRYPGFRLVKAGAKLDLADYSQDISWRPDPFTGVARVPRVLAEIEAGASAVLQGLHLTRTELAVYCRELEAFLEHPVQANAYFTPRRAQGLAVHHDTHDVFVLQVSGRKRWLVYDPVFELPLKHQRYSPELGGPGDTVLDVDLRAGDTLYLPRGWLHEATTSDEDSLHLTIGVAVVTWLDAFRAALDRCGDDVEFRRSLSVDGDGAEELVERLSARLGAEEVATARRERFVRGRRPVLEGQLAQLSRLDHIGPDTVVERRPTVVADLDEAGLRFEGKTVRFPPSVRDELETLVAATHPIRLGDLPGRLDDAGRTVLARRLVREGFLRLV